MILEKLNKKANLKKIIWLSSWILEVDKIARETWVHGAWGGGSKGRWLEGREKGRMGDSLGEWDGRKGGKMDMGAGKNISQLREPF